MNKLNYYYNQFKAEIHFLPMNLRYVFSTKKRVIYIGCTDMGNLGDEAILKAITLMFKSKFYFYPISYKKPSSGSFFRNNFFKSPNFICLGGGTIIRKGRNESYLRLLNKYKQQWPNAKTIVIGPGVSNLEFAKKIGFPTDKEAWLEFLDDTVFIGVRGNDSKSELESWGVNKPINIFHDPTVYFTKAYSNKKKKDKRIGLNFADIGDRIYGGNKKQIEQFAKNLVELLLKNNWDVFLYPTTKSDLNYMLNVIGLKEYKKINIYKNYTNLKASLSFLESLDLLIGQRLHSIIFSGIVHTPFFALEYEPKTSDFLDTINMKEYSSRVDNLDVNEIYNSINDMYLEIDTIQSSLCNNMNRVKEEQLYCKNLILSEL